MAHKVVAAAVVTADGTRLRCHANAHPDLLWALRGGAVATPWSPTWSWGWTGYRNCSAASRMAGERGWRACRPSPNGRTLLARTGMRADELADLEADAVVQIGAGHWLRIPLGKLRNDRYVPLHPELVTLLAAWTAASLEHIRRHKRLAAGHRGPLDRHLIGRIVSRAGRAAGVPGVHPHRLRHTLATQAINRGMRLEAIAALPGHQKMEMTLIYAKIANRVVAGEYAAASAKIDALYGQPPELPAGYETTGMARLRREAHARMPGNGLCTRPAELDCRLESACQTCAYFRTGTQFLPILGPPARPRPRPRTERTSRAIQRAHPARRSRTRDHRTQLTTMPEITLDLADAAELAETLTFLASWLSGSQKRALADSFTAFVGHPAYNTDALCADLHRFAFLLGVSDGEELFGEPTP
jgi:Phage integrase family